jgi:hypothetical protein
MSGALAETVVVTVEHLGDGHATDVRVVRGVRTSSVAAVKKRVSELDGIAANRQLLFRADAEHCLDDDEVLRESCTVYLLVGDASYGWDSASPLLSKKGCDGIEYRDRAPCELYTRVSTKLVCRTVLDVNHAHTMGILPSIRGEDCSGEVVTISLRFTCDTTDDSSEPIRELSTYCGLMEAGNSVTQSARSLSSLMTNSFVAGWGVRRGKADGILCRRCAGTRPHFGVVVTMQWDTDKGTLRFLLDGKPHGSDLTGIPKHIPMQWAVEVPHRGSRIEIVEGDALATLLAAANAIHGK